MNASSSGAPKSARNKKDLAVLMGNGVSIAANPDLALSVLTEKIRRQFEIIDPKREAPDRVLARLAGRGRDTGDPMTDFEALIGPLDQQTANLGDLLELAELVGEESPAVAKALKTAVTFVHALRRLGAGHAVNIIAEESVATFERRQVVEEFLEAVVGVVPGRITIGNLNYDSLAMASLLNVAGSEMCDMVRGDRKRPLDPIGTDQIIMGAPMRTSANDFPMGRRIRLVHPHGSLTWFRDPSDDTVYRFDLDGLRWIDAWAAWRDGRTEWEPQVVLTNQSAKSDLVTREPFNLSYEALYNGLASADRWLIAGYSFRDECVNDVLKRAWDARSDAPRILVVTHGDSPAEQTVLDAIGHNPFTDPAPSAFLNVCRCGIADAPSCATWQHWAPPSAAMTA